MCTGSAVMKVNDNTVRREIPSGQVTSREKADTGNIVFREREETLEPHRVSRWLHKLEDNVGHDKLMTRAPLRVHGGWVFIYRATNLKDMDFKADGYRDSYIRAIKKATDLQFTSTVESLDSSTEENAGRRKRKLKPNARIQDFITETKGRKKLQTLPYVKPKSSKVQEKDSSSSDESDLNIVFPQANSLKPIFHEQNSSTNGLESDSESGASVYCAPESDKNNSTAVRQHLLKEIFPDRRSTGELDAEPKVLSNIRGELRRFQEVVIKELKEIKTKLEIVRSSVVRQNQSRKPTCPFRIPFSNDCDVTASEEVLYSDTESF
ncbi:unnamed protein product, partial [Allacma fusca]